MGGAYFYSPTPSASALLGKSYDYVAAYTDAYKATAKSIQTRNAWFGCCTWSAVYAMGMVVYYYWLLEAY